MKENNKKYNLSLLSKYRSQIYGLAILWIVIFHGHAILGIDYSLGHKGILQVLSLIINSGNVGCEIFFILSGICLYFSFSKDSDYYSFIKKRLVKLFLTVWVIAGLFWLYKFLILNHFDWSQMISSFLLILFWQNGDQTIWFVSTILLFYLLYPYIYKFIYAKKDNKSIIIKGAILMVIAYLSIISFAHVNPTSFRIVEIGITRLPSFILGCILGKFVYDKRQLSKLWLIPMILLCILFYVMLQQGVFHGYHQRLFYLVGGISLTYICSYVFWLLDRYFNKDIISRAFAFLGNISLELYVTHIIVLQIYRVTPLYKGVGHISVYMIIIVISIIVAYLASKPIEHLKKKVL